MPPNKTILRLNAAIVIPDIYDIMKHQKDQGFTSIIYFNLLFCD